MSGYASGPAWFDPKIASPRACLGGILGALLVAVPERAAAELKKTVEAATPGTVAVGAFQKTPRPPGSSAPDLSGAAEFIS
jgi:hypothetical protein